jgi:hypothetical protein
MSINFFIVPENYKSLCALRGWKKLTAEYAETAELLLGKNKKQKSFCGYGLLFVFRFSRIEDQRMNEEEAESAKVVP